MFKIASNIGIINYCILLYVVTIADLIFNLNNYYNNLYKYIIDTNLLANIIIYSVI